MGISIVGIAFGLTNLYSIYTDAPSKIACQVEHVKAAVGAGISVYAAFMACGLARLNPGRALNQKMWAIPLLIGLTLIIICIRPGSGSRGGARRPSSAPCPTQSRPAIAAPSTMADASSDGARSSRAGSIAVSATPAPPAGSPPTASRRRIRGMVAPRRQSRRGILLINDPAWVGRILAHAYQSRARSSRCRSKDRRRTTGSRIP